MSHLHNKDAVESEPRRLSDSEWERIEHLVMVPEARSGRPRQNARQMVNAVLWACFDDHKWHRLPASYPPQQTCYLHFLRWRRDGVLRQIADKLEIPYDALCAIPAPRGHAR